MLRGAGNVLDLQRIEGSFKQTQILYRLKFGNFKVSSSIFTPLRLSFPKKGFPWLSPCPFIREINLDFGISLGSRTVFVSLKTILLYAVSPQQ